MNRLAVTVVAWALLVGCRAERPQRRVVPDDTRLPSQDLSTGRAAPEPAPAPGRSPLGVNLSEFVDYSPEWSLIDVFKASRPWIGGRADAWEDGRPVDVDEHGWVSHLAPGQIARTLMFWGLEHRYPTGEYVVTYEGTGSVDYWSTAEVIASEPGRDRILVRDAQMGIALFLTSMSPDDPIRNIRVAVPGGACIDDPKLPCRIDAECPGKACVALAEDKTLRFHPRFLQTLAPFSVLRFMDWGRTNGSKIRAWADRPKPSDARYTERGVPVEVMLELAKVLDADPWVCVPHLADDDYVRSLANLAAAQLGKRRIYVELSNEVWNGMFEQFHHAEREGQRLGLGTGFEAAMRWYARRSVEVFRIFENVFGADGRLVRVVASQSANPWVAEQLLGTSVAEHADVLAIAPYFGGELGQGDAAQRVRGLTVDQLLDVLSNESIPYILEQVRANAAIAREHGLRLVAYEGGQHLAGVGKSADDAILNGLFDQANRHPRMGALYTRYLEGWRQAGGTLMMLYSSTGTYSRYGRWGLLEWTGQSTSSAPKYEAVRRFASATPRWW